MNEIAKTILTKLNKQGFQAYIVGGYVRDLLLGHTSNDIDICTNAKLKDLVSLFSGKMNEYGSLNIKINEFNIDITTFRKENEYKNRKPIDFEYIDDLEQELVRRDFTINTICMDKNGKVLDFFNGIQDLNQGLLRSVGDVSQKLKEDPLRILRAIRFSTVLDFTLDKELVMAIFETRTLLKKLSFFRIKEELSRILLSKNYQKGLDLLKKFDLDSILNISYVNVAFTSDLCGMWAQINFPPSFSFTKNEKNTIRKIREIVEYGSITYEILYTYGLYLSLVAGEILGISNEAIHEMYRNMPIYERKDLQIEYLEIAHLLHLPASKKVKNIEKEVIKEVLLNRVKNSYSDIKKYLLENQERWNQFE